MQRINRALACLLALMLVFGHTSAALAQSVPDIQEPSVEIEIVDSAAADLSQVFTVQASDDLGLGDVTLHYRRSGENIFQKITMEPVGDTGFFSVSVETDPNDLRPFEYYAQALDLTGNRTVKGFAFDPFVRNLTESEFPALATAPATTGTTAGGEAIAGASVGATVATEVAKPSTNSTRRWVYIALGVLAAGAVASQLGGSDSSGGDMTTGDGSSVPLTVIIRDPLQ